MITIEKKYHFYAAHRNKQAGEKCGRIHGHTYDVVCHFKFEEPVNGVTMLFSEIDKAVEPIIKCYDHYLILYIKDPLVQLLQDAGEVFSVIQVESSAENLAKLLFDDIERIAGLPIFKIELAETKSSNVIYER